MWLMNDKAFKRLWWVSLVINLAVMTATVAVIAHFVRKYW